MSEENFVSRWSKRKIASRTAPAEAPAAAPAVEAAPVPAPLPPIESLTPESDITAFMKPHVEAALKREAIKAILRDPRFNVMDGLDVYIDDYSIPDPMPPEWLDQLNQVARLGEYKEPPPAEPPQEGGEGTSASDKMPADQQDATAEAQDPSHTGTTSIPPLDVGES